ncbi:MAG: DUF4422 domain-containing protein [Bacteroides sp.]|nr:DUF4422 domain-containing protein [Bacteroides sp.]
MATTKDPQIKILVACHKEDSAIRNDKVHMPIHVGKALHPDRELGFQGDNTGDNISHKNDSYCELTAMYWAWKNLPDIDFIGLAHYRRYFDLDITEANLLRLFKRYDIIIGEEKVLPHSIIEELFLLTSYEDTYILLDAIYQKFPELRTELIEYFYYNNKWTNCNMFIAPKHIFDEYCTFLFPLMEQVEKNLKMSHYTRMRRVIGYLTEPLLGFWIHHKRLRSHSVGLIQIIDGFQTTTPLHRKISNIKKQIAFKMINLFSHKRELLFDEWVLNGLRADGYNIKN